MTQHGPNILGGESKPKMATGGSDGQGCEGSAAVRGGARDRGEPPGSVRRAPKYGLGGAGNRGAS